MSQVILTLNTGSSSVKFRVFAHDDGLPLRANGRIMDIGNAPVLTISGDGFAPVKRDLPKDMTHHDAALTIGAWLRDEGIGQDGVAGVAHRIVHGGGRYNAPVILDQDIMNFLHTLEPLAPLHQPHNLAGVEIFAAQMPDVPQIGCFDTAFHAGMDDLRSSWALPADIRAQGVRRYGFHGLSYAWIAHVLRRDYPHLSGARVVAAHLGNGASLCVMQDGRGIDTSMGMTALDGLIMGTRSGAIDAGAVIYMIREMGMTPAEVEEMLYYRSGLKGLSGISNDVQALSASDDPRAQFALSSFAFRAAQHIAMMAVSAGGMDALVFTGGIGENAENIRAMIGDHLSFMPPYETVIIPANEERYMAMAVEDFIAGA